MKTHVCNAKAHRSSGAGLTRTDPTRTGKLRRKLTAELTRRFNRFRLEVVRLIAEEDALGLRSRGGSGEGAGIADLMRFPSLQPLSVANLELLQPSPDWTFSQWLAANCGGIGSGVPGPCPTGVKPKDIDKSKNVVRKFAEAARSFGAGVRKALGSVANYSKEKTKQLYKVLEGRYGRGPAITIMASAQVLGWGALGVGAMIGVPLYLPGVSIWGSIPAAAVAETILQGSRAARKAGSKLKEIGAKIRSRRKERGSKTTVRNLSSSLSEETIREEAKRFRDRVEVLTLSYLRERSEGIVAIAKTEGDDPYRRVDVPVTVAQPTTNVFCPTGEGGGIDPTCESEVTVTRDTAKQYTTTFTIGDKEFFFDAQPDEEGWHVGFGLTSKLGKGGTSQMTNDPTVSPVKVLAAVQKSLDMFLKAKSPESVLFTAEKHETSRVKFYHRVVRLVGQKYGYNHAVKEYPAIVEYILTKPPTTNLYSSLPFLQEFLTVEERWSLYVVNCGGEGSGVPGPCPDPSKQDKPKEEGGKAPGRIKSALAKVEKLADKIPGVKKIKDGAKALMGKINEKLTARYGAKAAKVIMLGATAGTGYGVAAVAMKAIGIPGIPVVNDLVGIAVNTAIAETIMQGTRGARAVGRGVKRLAGKLRGKRARVQPATNRLRRLTTNALPGKTVSGGKVERLTKAVADVYQRFVGQLLSQEYPRIAQQVESDPSLRAEIEAAVREFKAGQVVPLTNWYTSFPFNCGGEGGTPGPCKTDCERDNSGRCKDDDEPDKETKKIIEKHTAGEGLTGVKLTPGEEGKLKEFLDKQPTVDGNVYRVIDVNLDKFFDDHISGGSPIPVPALQGFTLRRDRVYSYGRGGKDKVLLILDGAKAGMKDISRWSKFPEEKETLSSKGMRLKITGQHYDESLGWQLRVEPIHPTTANARWADRANPEKLKAFAEWIEAQLGSRLIGLAEEELWRAYAEEGVRMGAARSFDDVNRSTRSRLGSSASAERLGFYAGTKSEFLRQSFAKPVAIERIKVLATRSFEEMKGLIAVLKTRMLRTLADGLVQGKSPREIARALSQEIDVSKNRALVIARTEIIRANADGQLMSLRNLGVEKVGIAVEWAVVRDRDGNPDDKVCPLCRPLDGVVMTLDEAEGLLPRHPSCRCAWIPANVGEKPKTKQKKTQRSISSAIETSLERDKRSKETVSDEGGSWAGEDVKVAKVRPTFGKETRNTRLDWRPFTSDLYNGLDPALIAFSRILNCGGEGGTPGPCKIDCDRNDAGQCVEEKPKEKESERSSLREDVKSLLRRAEAVGIPRKEALEMLRDEYNRVKEEGKILGTKETDRTVLRRAGAAVFDRYREEQKGKQAPLPAPHDTHKYEIGTLLKRAVEWGMDRKEVIAELRKEYALAKQGKDPNAHFTVFNNVADMVIARGREVQRLKAREREAEEFKKLKEEFGAKPVPPLTDHVKGESKAEVRVVSKRSVEQVQAMVNKTFGRDFPLAKFASIVGAPDDAKVTVTPGRIKDTYTIRVKHSDYTALRTVHRDEYDGKMSIKNDEFFMKEGKGGQGLGAKIFANQVAAASREGFSEINTYGAGSVRGGMNGYYTWPRLGYDVTLAYMSTNPSVRDAVQKEFPHAKTIADVMLTERGRGWWKQNGQGVMNYTFDLSAGSRSMKTLANYMEEGRQKRAAKGGNVKNRYIGNVDENDLEIDDLGDGYEHPDVFPEDDEEEEKKPTSNVLPSSLEWTPLLLVENCGGEGSGVPGPCPEGGTLKVSPARKRAQSVLDRDMAEEIAYDNRIHGDGKHTLVRPKEGAFEHPGRHSAEKTIEDVLRPQTALVVSYFPRDGVTVFHSGKGKDIWMSSTRDGGISLSVGGRNRSRSIPPGSSKEGIIAKVSELIRLRPVSNSYPWTPLFNCGGEGGTPGPCPTDCDRDDKGRCKPEDDKETEKILKRLEENPIKSPTINPAEKNPDDTLGEGVKKFVVGKKAAARFGDLDTVAIKDLIATQTYINSDKVAEIVRDLKKGNTLDSVIIIKQGGKQYVGDGHHRIEAYKLKGIERFRALVVPVDENGRPTNPPKQPTSNLQWNPLANCGGEGSGKPGPCPEGEKTLPKPDSKEGVKHLTESLKKTDRTKGGFNLVHLGDLQDATGWSRENFLKAVAFARRAGRITLSGAEGRHGISARDSASAIREKGSGPFETILLYASSR